MDQLEQLEGEYVECKTNPKYLIFRDGRVYGKSHKKFLKTNCNGLKSPYRWIRLSKKKHYHHRLVAQHFIENPDNLSDCHHIDGDPENNHADNLEWLTHKENILKQPLKKWEHYSNRPNSFLTQTSSGKWYFNVTNRREKVRSASMSYEDAVAYRDAYILLNPR